MYIQNVIQCYMTELPLSVTHFKILLHLMYDIVVPVLLFPRQTSVTVVSHSSLFNSIVSKEMHYT